jgi:hypothetical protein
MSVTATIQAFEKVVDTVLDELVVYRPTFGKLTGSVTAGILLERIRYYAKGKNYDEFYKFNSICSHKDYRKGDSWEEELGFTRFEFEGARNRIATKVAKGDSKKELLKVFDETGELMPVNNIVLYWRDSSNKIWYQFNEPLYMAHLLKIANAEIANAEIHHYLEMRKSHIPYGMRENHATLSTENPSENTTEKKEKESLSTDKADFSDNQPSAILVEEKAPIEEVISNTYQLPQFMKLALLAALARKSKAVEQAEAHIAALEVEIESLPETEQVPDVNEKPGVSKPKAPLKPYQEVVRRALGKPGSPLKASGYVGRYVKFFEGKYTSGEEALQYQLSGNPMSPSEIIGLSLWYRPTYNRDTIPTNFDKLRLRCDEFRSLPNHDKYVVEGERRLAAIMSGIEITESSNGTRPSHQKVTAQQTEEISPEAQAVALEHVLAFKLEPKRTPPIAEKAGLK